MNKSKDQKYWEGTKHESMKLMGKERKLEFYVVTVYIYVVCLFGSYTHIVQGLFQEK